jgi:hypothetical protein
MLTYNYKTFYEFCNSYKIILNDNYENNKNKTIEQKMI